MSRGHDRERAVADLLRQDDWFVVRAAGSLGDADLLASRLLGDSYLGSIDGAPVPYAEVRIIEVKSTAGGPYERFEPAKRASLRAAAVVAGATAWLAYWPPRKPLRWIPESEWPS